MNIHQNARLTPLGRERLVRLALSGLSTKAVAETMGVCPKTVGKWMARFEAEGIAGLQDRSSRPHSLHRPTPAATQEAIAALRRQRLTGAQIAHDLSVSPATVSRVLRRHGLSRIADLEPPPPVQRYERARPGELIHIDIKKLGRFARTGHRITGERAGQSKSRGIGWEYLHLAIDDHSRLAYSELHPDEKRGSCLAFLVNALRFFRRHGIAVERVMTDNVLRSEEGRLARQQVSVREHAPAVCLSSTSIQAAPADPEELSAIANTGSSRRASRRGPHRPQHEMSIQAGDPSIIYRVVVLTPSRLC